jgi:hypothetical protein
MALGNRTGGRAAKHLAAAEVVGLCQRRYAHGCASKQQIPEGNDRKKGKSLEYNKYGIAISGRVPKS